MRTPTFLLLVFLISPHVFAENTHTITVNIDGISPQTGNLFVQLYQNEENFLIIEKAISQKIVEANSTNTQVIFTNMPAGEYAVAAFHDINNNAALDFTFYGKPKESTGTSNDAKGFMGPPKFKDAKFTVNGPTPISFKMNN